MRMSALLKRWPLWGALLLLAACVRATPAPTPTPVLPTVTPSPTALPPLPTATPVLTLLDQDPSPQAALPLRPTLCFTFSLPLDPDSARQAFALSDTSGNALPGEMTFPDGATLCFTPDRALQPAAEYRVTFTTDLHATDGTPLDAPRTLTYTTEEALNVTQVYPGDGDEGVSVDTEITVVFNKPVAPLTSREEAEPLPLQFDPPINGQGRWVSSSIYVFRPDEPLNSGTTYQAFLPAEVQTFNGDILSQPYAWSFTTEVVRVTDIEVDHAWALEHTVEYARRDAAIQVYFSQPMDHASVERHLSLTAVVDGSCPPLQFKWDEESTVLTITPEALYAPDVTYKLEITAARAQDGGTLQGPVVAYFHTAGPPTVVTTDGPYQSAYSPWIEVEFASYLDETSLSEHIRIEPQPKQLTWTVYGRFLHLGTLEAGTTYTITLLPGIRDIYGEVLTDPYTFQVTTAHLQPDVELLVPGGRPSLLRFDGPQTVWLRYANLDTVQLSLYPLDDVRLVNDLGRQQEGCPANQPPMWQQTVDLSGSPRDRYQLIPLHLAAFNGNQPVPPGAYCLRLRPQPAPSFYQDTALLLIVTDHITLKDSPKGALVWVTDLETATPQAGLPVTLYALGKAELPYPVGEGTTDDQGLARWDQLPGTPRFAWIHTADRYAFVDASWNNDASSPYLPSYWWVLSQSATKNQAFVYTDRPLYRPGQQIFFKGIVRQEEDLHYTLPDLTQVVAVLYHEDTEVARQKVNLSPFGTFHGSFVLAEDAPVGGYFIRVYSQDKTSSAYYLGSIGVRVAAYHKPVFEVDLTPDQTDLFPGEKTTVHLQATYYAGDAVGDAQVEWRVDAERFYFTPPPDLTDFVFSGDLYWPWEGPSSQGLSTYPEFQTQKGVTDPQGRLDLPLAATDPAFQESQRDIRLTVWASVTDRGGNSADGHTEVIVRQSGVYVGLKTDGWLTVVGDPLHVSLVVLDPQGNPMADRSVTVEVAREVWHSVQRRDANGILRWESHLETEPVTTLGPVTTDARGRATVTFTPDATGTYRLVAHTSDDQGRPREAVLRVWVAGTEALTWKQESHTLPLIPDKPSYRPGETVHLLVPRPYAQPTYALVTLERGQIYEARVVRLDQPNNPIDLPLGDEAAPVIYASVVTLRPAGEDQPPDYRLGVVRLPVALDERKLQVTVTTDRETVGPGEVVHLTVETRTTAGQPVSAEVSLAVVDKALLALAPDTFDLLEALYPERSLGVATALGLVADQEAYNAKIQRLLPTGMGMGSGGGGKGADLGGVITVRESFRDTAYWKARVVTDPQTGRAEVTVPLPDNLTTWVVRARAVTQDTRVGEATAEVMVNRPFFVRLHTPAFFTAGDRVTLQAVVHNTTGAALTATVRLAEMQGVILRSPVEQTVEVPAQGQAVVTWLAEVPFTAQRVDLLVAAQAGAYEDASRPLLTLLPDGGIPVYAFHTVEAVGASGMLTEAAQVTEGVRLPAGASQATLRVEASGSVVVGLSELLSTWRPRETTTAAAPRCPYTFAQHLLTYAAVLQGLSTLGATPADQVSTEALRLMQSLYATQNADGGWGWCADFESDPAVSTLATWALIEARAAGLNVDADRLEEAGDYLRETLVSRKVAFTPGPNDLTALMIDMLAQLGRSPTYAAYRLAEAAATNDALSLGGWALLLHAAQQMDMGEEFTQPILRRLEDAVAVSATGAHWDGSSLGWWGLASDQATTALILRTLITADPEAPFLPQVARWLMTVRGPQGWGGRTTNALVALSLSRWARFTGETHPDFDYRVVLNGTLQAQGHLDAAHLADPLVWAWPQDQLDPQGLNTLTLGRGPGPGVLYYTAYLDLSLPAENLAARADGVGVSRAYYALDDLETPITTFHPGQIVQVRLSVTAPHDLHHVVLTDYLPAGFEALNPATTLDFYPGSTFTCEDFLRYGWGGWYFDHRETYDDRAVFVAEELPAGVYTVTYYVRVTLPGRFQVRPAVAYEADFPDVRGRSAGGTVEVGP